MRITIDGVDLPGGVQVDLLTSDNPQVVLRVPATSSMLAQVAVYADGKPHVLQWWNGDVLLAEAHANLSGRLMARSGDRPESAIYELWGQAWGKPPNYGRFLVGVSDGGEAGNGQAAQPEAGGTA